MSGWAEFWDEHALKARTAIEADGYCIGGSPLPLDIVNAVADDIAWKLQLSTHHSFLEAGCGAGLFLSLLRDKCAGMYGCDLSANMIKKAGEFAKGVPLCVSEASRVPFAPRSFDRVLCYSVFLCFPDETYAKEAVRELVRVTKPGGKILIGELSDPAKLPEYHREKERLGLSGNGKSEPAPLPQNNLKYLNLSPAFFEKFLPALDEKFDFHILPQNIPGKVTSILRYDVLIELHGN